VWGSSPAVDLALQSVFVTTGDIYSGPSGNESIVNCLKNKTYEECVPKNVNGNSILALDLLTGRIKWSYQSWQGDFFSYVCLLNPEFCKDNFPQTLDYDFGQGPMIITNSTKNKLVCAGDKGGLFHCVDALTGQRIWRTRVGPGSLVGGMEWGSAYDGKRIYVALANFGLREFVLPLPEIDNDPTYCIGAWAALDPDKGTVLWMTPDPSGENMTLDVCTSLNAQGGAIFGTVAPGQMPIPYGPVSATNGVVFGTTLNGHLYAFDSETGKKIWQFDSPINPARNAPASMATAPAIVGHKIYFGTGYLGPGSTVPGQYFYAYGV